MESVHMTSVTLVDVFMFDKTDGAQVSKECVLHVNKRLFFSGHQGVTAYTVIPHILLLFCLGGHDVAVPCSHPFKKFF